MYIQEVWIVKLSALCPYILYPEIERKVGCSGVSKTCAFVCLYSWCAVKVSGQFCCYQYRICTIYEYIRSSVSFHLLFIFAILQQVSWQPCIIYTHFYLCFCMSEILCHSFLFSLYILFCTLFAFFTSP